MLQPMINSESENSLLVLKSGVSISYKKSGSGPPLIFFHGLIGNEDTFGLCHDAFASHFTVYRPAWPGYGNSSPLPDFSIEDLVEIGKNFIQSLGHPSVTLVGNCLGGNVAMELARRYPDMVRRLILIELYAYFPWYFLLLLVSGLNRILYRMVFQTRVCFYLLNSFMPLQQRNGNNGWMYTWEGFNRTPVESALGFLKAIRRFYKKMHPIYVGSYRSSLPVIYVEGGRSFGPVKEFIRLARLCFLYLTVVGVPESLHNPVVEQPNLFCQRILEALNHPESLK
ncbi:MAG: alpha/beta hydrolase [Deltaproteobacteria bacterium]|nr:alpha/beta hydrolase [Deltaproteobacteria bacterium]